MRRKQPPRPARDAHFRIDQNSATWREVVIYLRSVLASASVVLEDPGAPMVSIRQAQGDVRTVRGLLKLANPDQKPEEPDVPEFYPTGGAED